MTLEELAQEVRILKIVLCVTVIFIGFVVSMWTIRHEHRHPPKQ